MIRRYGMRYRIIIGNFYNIQHMTFFCAIPDVLLLPDVTVNFIKQVIVYFFSKNLMVTRGNAYKMLQIFSCSIQDVW